MPKPYKIPLGVYTEHENCKATCLTDLVWDRVRAL